MHFHDRHSAGRLLAQALESYAGQAQTLVPRKIGAPGNPEFALGSIMEDGQGVFNERIIALLGVSHDYLRREIESERQRAHQRLTLYRQEATLPDVKDQVVILVDDGIATGSTMLTSIDAMRKANARLVVVAVPVASKDGLGLIKEKADDIISLYCPEDFFGVGQFNNLTFGFFCPFG